MGGPYICLGYLIIYCSLFLPPFVRNCSPPFSPMHTCCLYPLFSIPQSPPMAPQRIPFSYPLCDPFLLRLDPFHFLFSPRPPWNCLHLQRVLTNLPISHSVRLIGQTFLSGCSVLSTRSPPISHLWIISFLTFLVLE